MNTRVKPRTKSLAPSCSPRASEAPERERVRREPLARWTRSTCPAHATMNTYAVASGSAAPADLGARTAFASASAGIVTRDVVRVAELRREVDAKRIEGLEQRVAAVVLPERRIDARRREPVEMHRLGAWLGLRPSWTSASMCTASPGWAYGSRLSPRGCGRPRPRSLVEDRSRSSHRGVGGDRGEQEPARANLGAFRAGLHSSPRTPRIGKDRQTEDGRALRVVEVVRDALLAPVKVRRSECRGTP